MNFDGSSRGKPGPRGFGYVIQDYQGDILHVIANPLGHGDSAKAEVLGLLFALRELKKIGASLVCVKGDSKVVIGWSSDSGNGVWKYDCFIHEIWEIVLSVLPH